MLKEIINTPNAPAPIGPYSQAVKAGNTLYVSGQIAINPTTGELVTGTPAQQATQVMENLKAILTAAGLTMDNVVKCGIFLKNMDDFVSINQVYGTYFGDQAPARETVEVARLPKDVAVEISLIAVFK